MNPATLDSRPVIEAGNVSVIYGSARVLDIPSFQVFPNEVLLLLGPNGSGKTTLLLCLARLLKPSTGTFFYNGVPVMDSESVLRLHRRIAMVFQESLLLNGTVWDNVTLGLRLRKVAVAEIEARARKWMERFGIWQLAKRQAGTLSSGEAKRASLARAFVLQPDVLFMDEPFNALDSPTHQALIEDFESVLRETRVTTVMVTHDRNEAIALASRVVVLIGGEIRQIGTTESIFSMPADEEVANFIEVGNIIHGVVSSVENGLVNVDIHGRHIEAVSDLKTGTQVAVLLNNDDVTIWLPSQQMASSSARNQLAGSIVKLFPVGPMIKATIDCGFPLVALVTRRSCDELDLKIGQTVIASFKASAIQLIPRL